ncbi:hypothetical protein Psch_01743 [Pelotomaculum schinkii]|uniref:HepT-like domain-containing protein n=1 Tax=Pelotomaculum schinkii TaxID=78350 RepID=A0A4Y7RGQ2_9FIRM|nr:MULTISPECIES: hypothetical protein [Pelotomaculum]TEB08188.1 hypothetical protein Psch_01743 [Pelotomaculum schinkii]TEB14235.1 hypothetical protein Psfp_03056 [Pelotomaculum sp. FP]
MNKEYLTLASRVREEINELKQIVDRTQAGWERVKRTGDEFYLDSVALNLHSFYTALERIFELVSANVDQTRPKGENWHQELLRQMATEIELIRPSVISRETRNYLDEYRGFRHIVRNIYSFQLSSAKMAPLVNKLPKVFNRLKKEIDEFSCFLEAKGDVK